MFQTPEITKNNRKKKFHLSVNALSPEQIEKDLKFSIYLVCLNGKIPTEYQ